MAPKGGTFILLLIVASAALAQPPEGMPRNKHGFKGVAKRLMKRCQMKGYQEPRMTLLNSVFNNSDLPMEERKDGQPNPLISTFLNVLHPGSPFKDSLNQGDTMSNKMWNSSNLSRMIKMIRNSSEPSVCYLQAFLAPMSWAAWTTQKENDMDLDDYDTLLWAAKPVVQGMPSTTMNFPPRVPGQNMKKLMEMLQEGYGPMSEDHRTQVVKWAKEQITQNYFNCTTTPLTDPRSKLMERCKPSLKWLNSEALTMMGPYLSSLAPGDVDSSPKDKLCDFFHLAKFKFPLSMGIKMKPSLGKKFLNTFQDCFQGKDFAENVDKLGTLACHYNAAPKLTADLSRKLLPELDNCDKNDNPKIKKVKKQLMKYMMESSTVSQELPNLGSSVTLLSPNQLYEIPADNLKEVLKNLGPATKWTRGQLRTLVKKQLGNRRCKGMTPEELMALRSIAEGLPSCILRRIKAKGIDTEGLKNISTYMRKGQLTAMLQGLREDVDPSELLQMLPGRLLRRVSLNNLAKANINSLDQVKDKIWTRPQAAFLAKKMDELKKLEYRKLRSVLQGITCKMIDKVADSDTQDMAQAITETPQWLSKVQAGCAARKLFATLKKVRADYFKTITEKELDDIPTFLLLQLPPSMVTDLPDSVCPVFLDKMEEANLSSLPLRSPSRPTLTKRALLCLANGTNLSGLTTEGVSRLGPLLCELPPSQVRLMAPDVLNSTLLAMASCQHIPPRHRADLTQLVKETFGDPSDWSAETMEALGLLLLLDDDATSALPNKTWMKDVLYFLKLRMPSTSSAFKKKLFHLTTSATTSDAARRKRSASDTVDAEKPTVELIEELGMNNVYWTAAQLDQMSGETFLATLEILGDIPDYSADQLAVLSKKATTAFGPVSQMNESAVIQMGCIIQGFPDADLEKLPLLLDTLEEIAHCGWSESQIQPVWRAVAKYNNLTAQRLEATEMVALNRFICGLNPSETRQLNMEAFKDAVGSMDDIQCSYKAAKQLKTLAVSAFGNPSTFTEVEVSNLGTILAGLDATELASLDPSVMSVFSETCILLIPPENFASLSVAHLEALGPENAAAVTNEQRAALGKEKLAALERAATGSPDQKQSTDQSSQQSGAPSLSVEGIAAFLKPLPFLLMGFLLL